ncbi:hypothetical protein H0B56_05305 [Haloechinothrix sp. YIM 98757]|uniref:Uncharacterized protein n=1 Tax=Haloechinothrix aidingensis TaxID=2752311 RepID=A0A838A7A1_9PSEU|nr:hypothetical protein [Haloechinothrix aidingensis]
MLYIVLVLVLGALGLLVAALVTGSSLWAWISIGCSAAAALLLVVDWLRRRGKQEPAGEAAEVTTATGQGEDAGGPATEGESAAPGSDGDELDRDPDEEETDAADLLIVSELQDEVLVVDEHPRYHLEVCSWLADRDTLPISVAEARELGFTPCARCGPDGRLAAQHRSAST